MAGPGLHGRGLATATLLSLRKAPGSPLSLTPGWDPLQSPVRSPALQANSLPAEPPGKPQSITLGSQVSGPTSGGPVTLQMRSGHRKPLKTAGLGMLASRPSDNLRAGLPRAFSVATWLGPLRLGGPVFLPAELQASRVLRTLGVGEGSPSPVGASPSPSLPFLLHRSLPTSPCSPCPHLPLLQPGSLAASSLPSSLGAPLTDQPPVVSVGWRGAAGLWTVGRGLVPAPPSPLPRPQAGSSEAPSQAASLVGRGAVSGLLTSLAPRWPPGAGQVGHSAAGCWSLAGSGQPLPGSRQDGATAPSGLAGPPRLGWAPCCWHPWLGCSGEWAVCPGPPARLPTTRGSTGVAVPSWPPLVAWGPDLG